MESDLIDLTVQKLHETEKAVLVTVDIPERGVWIPKSRCEVEPSATGGLHTITLSEQLALEKGLI